ncbi:facilitated trehalose transporter Tret1-like [Photinus pyralis]|uniref:facilitated trehalose transporter Tret1-like n=1 Tax=Photinus pyralis TaxID=7054 RepID=UPI001266F0F6|nr:facilitated trehalose transporter Tret1-like [Photinus pyralis]
MQNTLASKGNDLIPKAKQFIATVCLGPVTLGASLSWTAPVLPQMQSENSTSYIHLTTSEGSWVGAMVAIGVLISALPSGYLADRYGVKKITIGLVLPVLLFTAIVVFARDVYVLCLGRLLSGIATGGISVVGPMYISEISDVSLRGMLGSFFEFLIYVGVVVVVTCGAYVHYVTLTLILGTCALVLGIAFIFLPESPTYLMKRNRRDKAEKALRFYRPENYNIDKALDDIYVCVNQEYRKPSIRKALQSRAVVRGLIAAVGLTIIQQLSCIDGVIFYTVQIFQAAGTDLDPFISSIIVAVVELLSAVIVLFMIERAGRKVFLYISCLGTGVCLGVLALYFHLKLYNIDFPGMDAIPLASIVIYAFLFSVGLGPVPYMIYGELFASEVKGLAIGITITTNWTCLFIITKTLPVMMSDLGSHIPFYMYSISVILSVVFIKFYIPETRGKSLEQIQEELGSSKGAIQECNSC